MTGSQRAYAKHRGCALNAVQKALKSKRIFLNADGKVDFEAADAAWQSRTHPTQGKRVDHQGVQGGGRAKIEDFGLDTGEFDDAEEPDFFKERAMSERARRKRLELDLSERIGELVELAPVNNYVRGVILKAREELLRIAPELRDRLAQEIDPIACETMVQQRVERALSNLAEWRPTEP